MIKFKFVFIHTCSHIFVLYSILILIMGAVRCSIAPLYDTLLHLIGI